MKITVSANPEQLGYEAGSLAASVIKKAIEEKGEARVVLATGSSQFETLSTLLRSDIDWGKVTIFHLDEYIGLPVTHKASFRKYLNERFISHIRCRKFHSIDTEGDIPALLRYLASVISSGPVDLGMIGIGENGHIAFNDPPADFETNDAYLVVSLDEKCRMQQVGEGWFRSMDEVPEKAVSMSVRQIMLCRTIVSAVPHSVKAEAVKNTLSEEITNMIPATILKQHSDWNLFLDSKSSSGIIKM